LVNRRKIETRVDYETKSFDFAPFVLNPATPRLTYKLCSVICHSGDIIGGHYVTYGLGDDHRWKRFDDSYISEYSKPPVKKHAYTLIYQRR
jgi:ubiquitin C-terminal hydrolase